jgi:alpha-1,2-mannosyltransferase
MATGGRYSTARQGRSTRRTAALVSIVLLVFAASLLTFSHGSLNLDITRLDLDVYRLGAKAWLSGKEVYGQLPSVQNGLDLGFTYPPISAVVMVPLAVVPARIAGVIMTALTIGLLLAVLALFLRTAGLVPDRRAGWRWAAALSPLAVLIEPVRTTLAFGQINVVLMALVAFDCLLPRTRWPRGVLVGVAAALKLTPAVFLLYFVATKQYRAAGWVVGSLAAVTGIGFLLAPHDSVSYWTDTVFQTGRVGSQSFFDNQSLTGLLCRAGLTGHVLTLVWLVCCVVVAGLGFVAIRSTSRPDEQSFAHTDMLTDTYSDSDVQNDSPSVMSGRLLPLCLTACVTLCVSPIAWSHHWVWASPALLTALALAWRDRVRYRRRLWLLAGALALFVVFPASLFPRSNNVEVNWAWWQQILGSAYVYIAVGLLAYYAVTGLRQHRQPAAPVASAVYSISS